MWHLCLDHMSHRLSLDLNHIAPKLGFNIGYVTLKLKPRPRPYHATLKPCHGAFKQSLNIGHVAPMLSMEVMDFKYFTNYEKIFKICTKKMLKNCHTFLASEF